MNTISNTAIQSLLISCHFCYQLSRVSKPRTGFNYSCPRCGAHLHQRRPNSLSRTWALVVTALIFYIPANMLPVMTLTSFGKGEPDTILSGIIALIESEMWAVALLVFFASFMVPLLKIIGLSYLLISVHLKSSWRPKDRTVLYRIIEAVGRWSMIDIFMISILVALVKIGSIASIEPGPGASFFAGVVVVTMFASMSFDPRLIWDSIREEKP